MSRESALKYLWYLLVPSSLMIALFSSGLLAYLPLLLAFIIIPLLELMFSPSPYNLSHEEEEQVLKNKTYSYVLYSFIPVFYVLYFSFLYTIINMPAFNSDYIGYILGFGLLTGLGINVAHELGHRRDKFSQNLAFWVLLPACYLHFLIEHYMGHHSRVSTLLDPATARKGETVYGFWFRSIILGYFSAWSIQIKRLKKRNQHFLSKHNTMLKYQLVQISYVLALYFLFGVEVMLICLAVALVGILLLESINYIEHYGLSRNKMSNGNFQRVRPEHSWNSNHCIGRCVLFELSRHSDHHADASRHYQVLRHYGCSPQMPTGYPGMVVLALFPPLWFSVMHKQLDSFEANKSALV